MNARTIRRAQERKALKASRRAELLTNRRETSDVNADLFGEPGRLGATPAQFEANRANAQCSTGPRTGSGKARSSLNAVKTGLTGKVVLLPSDDAVKYQRHVDRFLAQYRPQGDREIEIAQILADTQWRINRIPDLEMGIYALARLEFAEEFAEFAPAEAAALIQAQAFIHYHKQLNNLSIQEARLRRQYQKDLAELTQLQRERIEIAARKVGKTESPRPFPETIGFEFSNVEVAPSPESASAKTRLPDLSTAA